MIWYIKFQTKFYVVYRKNDTNEKLQQLLTWLKSDEGQALIEGCGYVGLPKEP